MIILGINAFHADSSACLIKNGVIVAAIEEERLTRVKHWAGFPELSIRACMKASGIRFSEIDKIALNRDKNVHKSEKILYAIKNRPKLNNVFNRLKSRKNISDIPLLISQRFDVELKLVKDKIIPVEHHLAHLYSTFLTSPYEESVVLSIDGFGDFLSTMWGHGINNKITIGDYVTFPHSLGLLYQSITQFLGFWNYGDEYKVMGMAAYGEPSFVNEIKKMVTCVDSGKFELSTKYFNHPDEGITMEFDGGYPLIGPVFSKKLEDLLGESRSKDTLIDQRHKDIAHSLQVVYEEVLFHILSYLNKEYPNETKLCLAGGCAQNSLANGKISSNSNFKDIWIQPAAGDSGGALGAALTVSNTHYNEKRHIMTSASLGLSYENSEIENYLKRVDLNEFKVEYIENEIKLIDTIVEYLILGKVIGFFHGAFEWGPRALGNRSIIVDPRIKDMKGLLNNKIKKRESFRPFAPSILDDQVINWFEKSEEVPFMTHVFKIKKDKRKLVPAITHQDGTGRLQTVSKNFNKRYYSIIKLFFEKTKVPMILNTSFNENEPIVNTPKEALDCFLRTNMDAVFLENYIISRNN